MRRPASSPCGAGGRAPVRLPADGAPGRHGRRPAAEAVPTDSGMSGVPITGCDLDAGRCRRGAQGGRPPDMVHDDCGPSGRNWHVPEAGVRHRGRTAAPEGPGTGWPVRQ